MCSFRAVVAFTVFGLFSTSAIVFGAPSTKRVAAMNHLWSAYTDYRLGNINEGRSGVEEALKMDPGLAYANIVRGEIAMQESDWATSRRFFERGLTLLKEPDQLLSPVDSIAITVPDVEGDTRCFLGYVYIKLAQVENQRGNESTEQQYLDLAHNSLTAGLRLTPGKEAREMAEEMLRRFK